MRKGLLVAALVLIGCTWNTVQRPVMGRGRATGTAGTDRDLPDSADRSRGRYSAVTRKKVGGKEEPATLIALDGTKCTVTPDRYRETAIGELVWCAWITG